MFTRCTPEEEEEANRFLALSPSFGSSYCLPVERYPAPIDLSGDKFGESFTEYPYFPTLAAETFDSFPVDTQQQQQRQQQSGYSGYAMQYPQTPSSTFATINPSLVSPVHEMFPEVPLRHDQLEVQVEADERPSFQYDDGEAYHSVHHRRLSMSSSGSSSDSEEDDAPATTSAKCRLPVSSSRHTLASRSMVESHVDPAFLQEENAEGESELDADPPVATMKRRHFPKRKSDDVRVAGASAVRTVALTQAEEGKATAQSSEPGSLADVVKSRRRATKSMKTDQAVLLDSPASSPDVHSAPSSRRSSPRIDQSIDSFSPPPSDVDTDIDIHMDSDDYAPILSRGVKKRASTLKKRRVGGRDPQKRQSQNQKAQCKYRQKRKQMAELDRQTTIKLLRLFGGSKGKGAEAKRQYFDALRDLDPTHHAAVLAEVEG